MMNFGLGLEEFPCVIYIHEHGHHLGHNSP